MQVQSAAAAKSTQFGDVSAYISQWTASTCISLQNISVDSFDLSSSDPIPTSQPSKVYVEY